MPEPHQYLDMNSVQAVIENELQCIKCKKFITNQIRQCVEGHNFCSPCFEGIQNCTNCYAAKAPGLNRPLDLLRVGMRMACRYQASGCSIKELYVWLQYHETFCDFALIRCMFTSCFWKGNFQDWKRHCEKSHPSVFQGSYVRILKARPNEHEEICDVIFVHGTCFLLRWVVSSPSTTSFSAINIGQHTPEKRHIFVLKIRRRNTDVGAEIYMGECFHIAHTLFGRPLCVKSFDEYFHNEELIYEIKIKEQNTMDDIGFRLRSRIFRLVKCRNCCQYMKGTIGQCTGGHAFCSRCLRNLEDCTICNVRMVPCRNLSLERVAISMERPCDHKNLGCSYRGNGQELERHYKLCIYSKRNCPTEHVTDCKWRGAQEKITKHCLKKHRNIYRCKSDYFHNYMPIPIGFSTCRTFMFFMYGRLFRISYNFHHVTKMFQVACYYVGDPQEKISFRFELSVLDTSGGIKSGFGSPCYLVADPTCFLIKPFYMGTDYTTWGQFCDENGKLRMKIQIFPMVGSDISLRIWL